MAASPERPFLFLYCSMQNDTKYATSCFVITLGVNVAKVQIVFYSRKSFLFVPIVMPYKLLYKIITYNDGNTRKYVDNKNC